MSDAPTDYPHPEWVKPGNHTFNTALPLRDELAFNAWLQDNKVPFDPRASTSDYDMRGFWQALQSGNPMAKTAIDPNDNMMHFPDYWKTPYHHTFSAESQWALPSAPKWNDQDQLIGSDGGIVFDGRQK